MDGIISILRLIAKADSEVWVFLIVSVLLAGAASLASGRALALGWRAWPQCLAAGALIALGSAFLHYALFQDVILSITDLGTGISALMQGNWAAATQIAAALKGYGIEFCLQGALALLGYRLTRVRQMVRQYRFAVAQAGPLGWRERDQTAGPNTPA